MQKECTVVDHQVNERSATRSRRLEMSRVTKSVAPPPPRRRTLFVATCCPHLMHDTPHCFLKCFFFQHFFPMPIACITNPCFFQKYLLFQTFFSSAFYDHMPNCCCFSAKDVSSIFTFLDLSHLGYFVLSFSK